MTIIPWATLLVFDIVLYICRMSMYEFPVVGGRARGTQRPHAPRLNERSGIGLGGENGDENEGDSSRVDKVKVKESGMNGELKRRIPNQVEG